VKKGGNRQSGHIAEPEARKLIWVLECNLGKKGRRRLVERVSKKARASENTIKKSGRGHAMGEEDMTQQLSPKMLSCDSNLGQQSINSCGKRGAL